MTLEELKPGQRGKVTSVGATGPMKRRIMDMGATSGVEIEVIKVAPLGDPIEVSVGEYELSLGREEAAQIRMEM